MFEIVEHLKENRYLEADALFEKSKPASREEYELKKAKYIESYLMNRFGFF